MKKLTFTLLAISGSFAAMAQQDPDLTDAILNHKSGLLDKAVVNIEKAIKKEKVAAKPKGWYERGAIYIDIVNSPLPAYKNLAGDSGAVVAYKSFKKTMELDAKDGSYAKDAKANMENVWVGVVNSAIKLDVDKKHKEALAYYAIASEIKPEDTLSYRNSVYSSVDMDDYSSAKKFYDKLVTLKYKNLGMYKYMADFAQKHKKQDDALAILEQGRKDYPDNKNLMIDELNIFLQLNQADKAKAKLDEAIKLDPSNTSLYLVKGDILTKEASKKPAAEAKVLQDEALALYRKALAADSMSFEGNYNVGTFYYNQSAEMMKKINNMDLATYQRSGRKVEADANKIMNTALPYFEKSHKAKPDDAETLRVLVKLYGYLKRTEKRDEADEKLRKLGK